MHHIRPNQLNKLEELKQQVGRDQFILSANRGLVSRLASIFTSLKMSFSNILYPAGDDPGTLDPEAWSFNTGIDVLSNAAIAALAGATTNKGTHKLVTNIVVTRSGGVNIAQGATITLTAQPGAGSDVTGTGGTYDLLLIPFESFADLSDPTVLEVVTVTLDGENFTWQVPAEQETGMWVLVVRAVEGVNTFYGLSTPFNIIAA